MGKIRDIFKKIRDTKGTFHAKMGTIKDRNGMNLTEEEDIKKRWQEYTELYIKDLHDPDSHDGDPDNHHSSRARHPGMQMSFSHPECESQVDLRKHRYEQSYWR